MNKRVVFHTLLGTAMLAVLLLAVLLLRPALAAPRMQEGAPELTIVKTVEGDGTIAPGATVCFTITVTNTGTVTATNVTVRDDYDQMALPTIQVLSDTELEPGGAENDGDVITWRLGDLPLGKRRGLSYEATAAEAFEAGITEVSNVASVQADNVEEVVQATVVLAVQAPHLTLTLGRERVGEEGKISPGDTVRYTIRYGNNGTVDATNVVLEATFDGTVDETVIQQVDNITGDGQWDGKTARWNLGTVAGGASDEVSYDVTLKPVLSLGTIEVRNEATIRADDVEPVSASDSFVLRTPLLIIERQREDLNGRPIAPGDTLRFTIRVANSGSVEAKGVTVRDDYDDTVVAEVSSVSAGGGEAKGAVEWTLTEPLKPGAEETVSYEVSLKSEISESTGAVNKATILIDGVEVACRETEMTIEPPKPVPTPVQSVVTTKENILEKKPEIGWMIFGLGFACLGVLVLVTIIKRSETSDEDCKHTRMVQEGTCVVLIAVAVVILRLTNCIAEEGTVSILAGIIGYVLGRTK